MILFRSILLAIFSSLLFTLSLPNDFIALGAPILGLVALVPLYWAMLAQTSPGRAAFVLGIFGALTHALSSYWLWFFNDFRFWTLGSSTLSYGVVYAVLGLYMWLFISKSYAFRPLAFVLIWIAYEYMKSNGFLAYPWALAAYTFSDAPLFLQFADITGVYGITGLIVLANVTLAECGLSWKKCMYSKHRIPDVAPSFFYLSKKTCIFYSSIAALLFIFAGIYGASKLHDAYPVASTVNAILVQQNTDPWQDESVNAAEINIALAEKEIIASGIQPDIIAFSETSLQRIYSRDKEYYEKYPANKSLSSFIKESKAFLLTGAPEISDKEELGYTNSAILIDNMTNLRGIYSKIKLVPFAELVPFWEISWMRAFMKNIIGISGSWVPGTGFSILTLDAKNQKIHFGTPICFEDAFPEVARQFYLQGADFLLNITNVSWSKRKSAVIQHWAAARFRAIESRKALVRSTNGGLTALVGPTGMNIATLPAFTADAMSIQIPIYKKTGLTFYLRMGDWFAWICIVFTWLLAIFYFFIPLKVFRGRKAAYK